MKDLSSKIRYARSPFLRGKRGGLLHPAQQFIVQFGGRSDEHVVRPAVGIGFDGDIDARGRQRMVKPEGHGDKLRRALLGLAHRQK